MTSLTLRAKSSRGPAIHDLADWERYAATKGKWADGFSAKELARLWLAGAGHRHVEIALVYVIPGLRIEQAIAEARSASTSTKAAIGTTTSSHTARATAATQ